MNLKQIADKLDKMEKQLNKMSKVVERLSSGLEPLIDFRETEIIDASKKAYVEVVGLPGKEKVYYYKGNRRRLAKVDKKASSKVGYVVAMVPHDADPRSNVGAMAGLIDRKRGVLIRVHGDKVQYKINNKWRSKRPSSPSSLDKRNIERGKLIKPAGMVRTAPNVEVPDEYIIRRGNSITLAGKQNVSEVLDAISTKAGYVVAVVESPNLKVGATSEVIAHRSRPRRKDGKRSNQKVGKNNKK